MAAAPVNLKGSTDLVREHAGRRCHLRHKLHATLDQDRAVIRATSDDTGLSIAVPITDRKAVYALHQIDEALMRSARKSEDVETRFKDEHPTMRVALRPPPGFEWCPECLGCPDLAPLCNVCDGNAIVRVADDE